MELGAHAVAHKVPDHGEAVGLHILLDRVGDVGHPVPARASLMPSQKLCWVTCDEPQGLVADLAAGEGGGAVAVEAVQIGSHVHADDVALLQLPGAGDAVDDHLVHRDAGGAGIAGVAQEGGLAAVALDEAPHRGVDLQGGDPGRTMDPARARAWAVSRPARRMSSISRGDFMEIISMRSSLQRLHDRPGGPSMVAWLSTERQGARAW